MSVKTNPLLDGTPVPVRGQGTWKLGEGKRPAQEEEAALRLGIDLGMILVDTAEMYADGRAEEVAAQAIAGQRERVFLVSKVYPYHVGKKILPAACERGLRRLSNGKSRRRPPFRIQKTLNPCDLCDSEMHGVRPELPVKRTRSRCIQGPI